MEFNEYQKKSRATAQYPEKNKIIYPASGLGSEVGEVLGKVKRWLRGEDGDGEMSEERKLSIKDELGDVLWYIAVLADDLGFKLEDVAIKNVEKHKSKKERDKRHG